MGRFMKLEVKNITKCFNDKLVLKNLNLEFESGKIYGLLGPNGSGKSVFLKILCGYYEPTEGKILLDGQDISRKKIFSPRKKDLIEKSKFFQNMSGYDNLKLVAKIKREIAEEDILVSLKNVNLLEDMDKKIKEYSDGMKRKLAVAQVLMENPRVIILDEPFEGLDDETKNDLAKILENAKYRNRIIIIAAASKMDIDGVVDVVIEFKDGQINEY